MLKNMRTIITLVTMVLLFSGCTTLQPTQQNDGPPSKPVDFSQIPDPIPHALKTSHYGNPPSYVINGKRYFVLNSAKGYQKRGIASWYGSKFDGRNTSSGEPYDMLAMTAASRTLPIPVFARVTNLENGRSVIVKVNDRGPFAEGRIIDLSYVAAQKLGYAAKGTARVEVTALTFDDGPNTAHQRLAHQPKLYLQVGAFSEQKYAENLQSKLMRLTGKPIMIQTLTYNHRPIYRVQIGPLAGNKESDKLHQILKGLGLSNPIAIMS